MSIPQGVSTYSTQPSSVVATKGQAPKAPANAPAADHGHDTHERAEHASHLMHELHLGAEVIEMTHHASHVADAKKVLQGFGRLSRDLQKASKAIEQAKAVGDTGKALRLQRAVTTIKDAIAAEQPLFRRAVKLVAGAKQSITAGKAGLRVGQYASSFAKVLEGSKIGQGFLKVGKVAAHPAVARALIVIGAAVDGVTGYLDSPAQTQAGKIANGALGAGSGALLMSVPAVAVADLVAPEGYKLSEVFKGGAAGITSMAEGAVTGDIRASIEMDARLRRGEYGEVMKEAASAGDFWARHGVEGTFRLLWGNL